MTKSKHGGLTHNGSDDCCGTTLKKSGGLAHKAGAFIKKNAGPIAVAGTLGAIAIVRAAAGGAAARSRAEQLANASAAGRRYGEEVRARDRSLDLVNRYGSESRMPGRR